MIEALRNGTRLHCSGGRSILLLEEINRGGNAITYSAKEERVDGTQEPRSFVVKEAVPADSDRFIRDDFEVVPSSKGDADASNLLRLHRDALIEEQNNGSALANISSRVYALWERLPLEAISYGNEKREITLEEQDRFVFGKIGNLERKGTFLSSIMRDQLSFYQTAVLIQKLLEALSDCHAAHVLHGDVSPGNVFFETKKNPKAVFGEAFLTDFATAKSVDESGKTAPILCPSSTRRYAAPEFYTAAPELSLSFDVYSVAGLWLDMLGLLPENRDVDTDLYLFVRSSLSERIIALGGMRACISKTEEILKKALQLDCVERYQTAAEMLEPVNGLVDLLAPPTFKLPHNLATTPNWVKGSRKEELKALHAALEGGQNPVYIWGLGGLGKSELARKLGQECEKRNHTPCYLITYKGSMRLTIQTLNLEGYSPVGKTEDEVTHEKLELLRKYYSHALFILDNYEVDDRIADASADTELQKKATEENDLFQLFLGSVGQVVITTRSRPAEGDFPELKELKENELLELFHSIAKDEKAGDEEILELIRAVDCHPLTVELMAATIQAAWSPLSVSDLLEGGVFNKDSSYRPVVSNKDRQDKKDRISGHLKALFQVANLNEVQKRVMCHASLLPEGGLDASLFWTCEPEEEQDALETLEAHSWLRRSDRLLRIHPLVKEVVIEVLQPSEDICAPFLDKLWSKTEFFDRKAYTYAGLDEMLNDPEFDIEAWDEVFYNAYERFPDSKIQVARLFALGKRYLPALYDDIDPLQLADRLPLLRQNNSPLLFDDFIEMDGSTYMVSKGFYIEKANGDSYNDNLYHYCVGAHDINDVFFRKDLIEDGEEYYTGLDSDEEVDLVQAFVTFKTVLISNPDEPKTLANGAIDLAFAFEEYGDPMECEQYLSLAKNICGNSDDLLLGYYLGVAEHFRDLGLPSQCEKYALQIAYHGNHFYDNIQDVSFRKYVMVDLRAQAFSIVAESYENAWYNGRGLEADQNGQTDTRDLRLSSSMDIRDVCLSSSILWYQKAHSMLNHALSDFEESSYLRGKLEKKLMELRLVLAEKHIEINRYMHAIDYSKSVISYYQSATPDYDLVTKANLVAARALTALEQPDDALKYLKDAGQSLKSVSEKNAQRYTKLFYLYSGLTFRALNRYKEWAGSYMALIEIEEQNASKLYVANILYLIGEVKKALICAQDTDTLISYLKDKVRIYTTLEKADPDFSKVIADVEAWISDLTDS